MLGEVIVEAPGQVVVRPSHAFAEVEQAGESDAPVGHRHHLRLVHAPAGDRVQDRRRLCFVVGEEMAHAHLVAEAILIPGLAHVVATGRSEQVAGAHGGHMARVVHRHLHAFHGSQVLFGPEANLLGGAQRALGEQVADAFAVGDHLEHGHHRVAVVELQLEAVCVFGREDPVLVALHRPGDRCASGDRVHPQVVADLVRLADGDDVIHAEVRAEGGERFVLRATVFRVHAVAVLWIDGDLHTLARHARVFGPRFNLDDLLAAHGAGVAGPHIDANFFFDGDGVHLIRRIERAGAIVEGGDAAFQALALHGPARAVFVEAAVYLLDGAAHPLGNGEEGWLVSELDGGPAADRDRFQLLRAHHRTKAAPPGKFVEVVGDVGETDEVLARGAYLGDTDPGVAELFADGIFDVAGNLAPEMAGVTQLHFGFVDPEVDGPGRGAVDDNRIPAGALQLGTPEPTSLGLAEPARERRLRANAMPPRTRYRGASQNTGRENQDVIRAERVCALGDVLQQVVTDEAAPAAIQPKKGIARLFDARCTGSQVNVEDLVPVSGSFHACGVSLYLAGRAARRMSAALHGAEEDDFVAVAEDRIAVALVAVQANGDLLDRRDASLRQQCADGRAAAQLEGQWAVFPFREKALEVREEGKPNVDQRAHLDFRHGSLSELVCRREYTLPGGRMWSAATMRVSHRPPAQARPSATPLRLHWKSDRAAPDPPGCPQRFCRSRSQRAGRTPDRVRRRVQRCAASYRGAPVP